MDFDKVLRLLESLKHKNVRYILVGGVALNIHGIVRATQDIDFFVWPDRENIERLKEALRAVWNDPEIDSIRYEELTRDYPIIRYAPPHEEFVIDLMTRVGEAFRYEDLVAEDVNWNGVMVQVATPRTLYNMKKDTLRPLDKADAAELLERFGLRED